MYTHSNTCYVHTQWPLHKKVIFQSLQEELLPAPHHLPRHEEVGEKFP